MYILLREFIHLKIFKHEAWSIRKLEEDEERKAFDLIEAKLNSMNDFLPELDSLTIRQPDCLEVDWNPELKLNRFAVTTMAHEPHTSRCHDDPFLWNTKSLNRIPPPASRLVGIELNPGPLKEWSTTAVSVAATLFNDGLLLIYSFLDDSEWLHSAGVSRHWFSVAKLTLPLHRQLEVTKRKEPSSRPLTKKVSRFFGRVFSSPQTPPPSSPWSLCNYVTSISLKIEKLSTKQLRTYCHQFPALTSFTITHAANQPFALDFTDCDRDRLIPFPSSLRSISIHIVDWPTPRWSMKSMINSIASVKQLESLNLMISSIADPAPPIDWSPLAQLEHLESLSVYPPFHWIGEDPLTGFTQSIARISPKSLRNLKIEITGKGHTLQARHVLLLKYDSLRTLNFGIRAIDGAMLVVIARTLPTLEAIESKDVAINEVVCDALTSKSPLFPSLRSINDVAFEAGTSEVSRLFPSALFTRLGVARSLLGSQSEWNHLGEAYPLLHTIRFTKIWGMLGLTMQAMAKSQSSLHVPLNPQIMF